MDTIEGQQMIHKIAKQRYNSTKDMICVKYIKSENGTTLTNEADIKTRWVNYFHKLLNEEFPRDTIEQLTAHVQTIGQITEEEVK